MCNTTQACRATIRYQKRDFDVLSSVQWAEDTPESFRQAKQIVYDLLASMTGSMPSSITQSVFYGNYSESTLSTCECAHWNELNTSIDSDDDPLPMGGRTVPGGAEALFKGNYTRLQKIKYKYDPDLVFNKWFPIQPQP